jgi:hypothetical protein
LRPEINPAPTPEEAAAIVVALEATESLGGEERYQTLPTRSRWEVAGRLGHPLPREMKLEGALWPLTNRGRSL